MPPSPAFDRVMAEPGSLAARHALLDEWRNSGDPRAALMERQLAYREIAWSDRSTGTARRMKGEITELIRQHGRAWAGRVAELVDEYEFHRGLVGKVTVSGTRFLAVAPELFRLAPIQHLNLTAPVSMTAIAASPFLARLATLHADGLGDAVGDIGAIALANSPHVQRLAQLSLWNDAVTRVGVDALASSRFLASARHVGLAGNPADPTPYVRDMGDGDYSAGCPALAVELERLFGPRPWLAVPTGHLPSWPGSRDDFAIVHDHVSDRVLAELEDLAQDVDRRAASTDEAELATAGARRQRLLIELDVAGLLAGTEAVGARVAKHPALLGYHAACVAMASYLASPARARMMGPPAGTKPADGHVSLDWFRVPSGYTPPGLSAHDWLALCERNFVDPMPAGSGSRHVRLEGRVHELLFRREVGPAPRLWRALPPEGPFVATGADGLAARSQRLAKDLLDQLDEPMSQERADALAQKEREDRAALERLYVATGQVGPEQIVRRALDEIADDIEGFDPPGRFAPIELPFPLNARQAVLRCAPSPSKPDRRYVELSLASASGQSTSSQWLVSGTNAELIAWLRRPEAVAETLATSEELARSIAMHRLA